MSLKKRQFLWQNYYAERIFRQDKTLIKGEIMLGIQIFFQKKLLTSCDTHYSQYLYLWNKGENKGSCGLAREYEFDG